MSSIASTGGARESMPEKPSIGIDNLDKSGSKSGSNSEVFERLLSEMKGVITKTEKELFEVEDAD